MLSVNQFSNVPGLSWVMVTVRLPDASAVHVVGANDMSMPPGGGVYFVFRIICPLGVAPVNDSTNGVDVDPLDGEIDSCGLTAWTPVPPSVSV